MDKTVEENSEIHIPPVSGNDDKRVVSKTANIYLHFRQTTASVFTCVGEHACVLTSSTLTALDTY